MGTWTIVYGVKATKKTEIKISEVCHTNGFLLLYFGIPLVYHGKP
jgi:hypothetical protein